MKLRDKDTKKYLLTVFVATFVAYIIPAVVLYLGHFMGIMLTICISLFNLSMALLAWLWAKFVRKEFLLKRQIILNSLATLLFIGIISLVATNGAALSLSLMVFVCNFERINLYCHKYNSPSLNFICFIFHIKSRSAF